MKQKSTDRLINELVSNEDINQYVETNQGEFLEMTLYDYLQQLLMESDLRVSQVADRSWKGDYIYQVFRGIKNPGRDVLISIALAMALGMDKSQTLLRIARMPALDPRNRRDSVLIFAISRHLTVPDVNDMLYELEQECL